MNYSQKLSELFDKTIEETKIRGNENFDILHFMYVSLEDKDSYIYQEFESVGLEPKALSKKIDNYLNKHYPPSSRDVEPLEGYSFRWVKSASERKSQNENVVLDESIFVKTIIEKEKENLENVLGIKLDKFEEKILSEKKEESLLDTYCVDLVSLCKQGLMDPVVGRTGELRMIMEVLNKKYKNNPYLKGEPGVGKTAVVNGLAHMIAKGEVVDNLNDAKIYKLNNNLLTATDTYKGELAKTIELIITELKEEKGKGILFIDEASFLMQEGGTDISGMLNGVLESGEVPVILASTNEEYFKTVGSNKSLLRKFQPIDIKEPSLDESISILRGLKSKLELHHGLKIRDEAIVEAVKTSHKYINNRRLPDKAIDVLDQACAFVKLNNQTKPMELDEVSRKLIHIEEEISVNKSESNHGKVAELETQKELLKDKEKILLNEYKNKNRVLNQIGDLNDEIIKLEEKAESLMLKGKSDEAGRIRYLEIPELQKEANELRISAQVKEKNIISGGDVYGVISRLTGIPLIKLEESDNQKYLNIEEKLKERVMGQDEALKVVSDSIIRSASGVASGGKPIGSFLFVGPTGVGKTESAKALAELLFDDEKKLVRLDMSEFQQEHMVQRLTGAPAGYVGYGDGGQLTEAVRQNPYSVILLDEIEKAHPKVWDTFLQILSDGRLTDGRGQTVDFTNTIIIMTSNIGGQHLLDGNTEEARRRVSIDIRDSFRPEFINRLDNIVYFNTLSQETKIKIVDKFIRQYDKRLIERGYRLDVDESVVEKILSESYDETFGARPIERYIEERIATEIGKYLLTNPTDKNIKITFDPQRGYIVNNNEKSKDLSR